MAAEETCRALGAASWSINRWERQDDVLRTLINVGELGPHEQRRPSDELYPLERLPAPGVSQRPRSRTSSLSTMPRCPPTSGAAALGKESAWLSGRLDAVHGGVGGVLGTRHAALHRLSVHFAEAIAVQLSTAIGRAELFTAVSDLASRDPLTGLANRRSLDRHLDEAIERAVAARTDLSVLFFDLDDLKAINDAGGHDAGDRALRAAPR